ncbi:hypothetical protein TIFTF001_030059 [Ficus carica]|uniref:Rx N-terminal domain-containing protein n=1 Tax=Ficus carica TaxID=3494 RepID=A0AA88DTI3_FICCA|nr:hypothetical protein TIFTF001_030059 [Ficus carica]
MAAELVGGALLSASLQFLFERIGSGEVFDYLTGKSKRGDFEELLGKLKIVLNSVSAVLDVAEQKQIKSRRVETWLDELQEAVFDAEDLLDRIESHAFQLKLGSKSSTATSKVRKSKKEKIQNLFSMSRNSNSDRNMERKMKRILERLEDIAKQMDFLGLKEGIGVRPSHRLPSTSLVEQSGVYAKFVAREYFVELKDGSRGEINVSKVRHLAYVMETNDPYRRFNHVLEATHLRTFLPVRLDGFEGNKNISAKIVDDLLMKLRCLRVLSFSGYLNVQQLPDSIGELTHLHYLDLSYTSISLLPESTSMLFNLQTLKLNYCQRLKKLPRDLHNLVNLRYLDVRSCINLAEMPPQLGELKSLQMLSTFIVGKDSGTKLGELREFSDLRGELHISKLENVADANDALDQANLMDKKHLEKLTLGWSYHSKDDSANTMDVLEMLLPNSTLKKLEIYEYPGTGFPKWLGSDSVSNIVFLRLSQCRNCSSLPPLGQLPSLKTLDISGLDAIVTVGPEFCGNGSVPTPFPSLEILNFNSMSSWEQWISVQAGNSGTFAKLRELYISDCDKLTGDLPCTLPSLTKLRINCKQFASPIPKIPSVRVLEFGGCENQLQCKKLDFPFFQPHKSLEVLNLHGSFDSLKSFPLDSFPKLKELYIHNSESLESFSVSDGQQQDLTALSTLIMSNCPSFAFFPDGGLPAPNLTFLSVGNCKKLKSLPKKMQGLLPSLEFLAIRYCPKIESFPEAGLPLNLRNLGIEGCDKLIASRLSWDLQRLPNLTSFTIHGTSRYEGAESVRTMRRRIRSYEGVESFPEEGLLPTTITSLSIGGFPNLKVLDRNGLQKLTSLRELRVSVCIELQITPERLPTFLKYFSISECPLLKKRCCKKNKEYWSEIDRIFCVKIGDEIVS